jgi:dihydroorotate dehydrogenase
MKFPIMVGAGVCKTPDSIDQYQHPDLPIGAVLEGSTTPDQSTGNKGTLSHWSPELRSGFNAYGMPNCGFAQAYHDLSRKTLYRPLIKSIAGFSPFDYMLGYKVFASDRMDNVPVSAIEFNFGCPNKLDKMPVPMSFDLKSMQRTLDLCEYVISRMYPSSLVPVWIKLSPYLTALDVEFLSQYVDTSSVLTVSPEYVAQVAELVARYKFIRAVVNGNTIGNCRYNMNGAYATTPNDGQAGLSGALLKEIAFRQTKELRNLLPSPIDVVHSGGILTGDDVAEALENGASAVQCTSLPYWHGGPKAFTSLLASEKLQNLLTSHN